MLPGLKEVAFSGCTGATAEHPARKLSERATELTEITAAPKLLLRMASSDQKPDERKGARSNYLNVSTTFSAQSPSIPPRSTTVPFGRSVAVCQNLPVFMVPTFLNDPVAGS